MRAWYKMVYADGKGNFFVDEETANNFKLLTSNTNQSSTVFSNLQSIFKDIEITDIIFVISLVILAIFLQGNAQFFVLGALIMFIGVIV